MELRPNFSIITAVLYGEKYLYKELESIYTQTFPDLEHIIIHDGSKNNIPAAAEDFF